MNGCRQNVKKNISFRKLESAEAGMLRARKYIFLLLLSILTSCLTQEAKNVTQESKDTPKCLLELVEIAKNDKYVSEVLAYNNEAQEFFFNEKRFYYDTVSCDSSEFAAKYLIEKYNIYAIRNEHGEFYNEEIDSIYLCKYKAITFGRFNSSRYPGSQCFVNYMRQKFYNKHGGAKTVQREVLNIIKEIDSLKGKPYADALTKYEKLMDN